VPASQFLGLGQVAGGCVEIAVAVLGEPDRQEHPRRVRLGGGGPAQDGAGLVLPAEAAQERGELQQAVGVRRFDRQPAPQLGLRPLWIPLAASA